MQCFAFNTRRDYFKDRRVREAIATMFDFAWSNKNLFYGLYKRNISFFGNSELASSGLPTPAELKYLEPLRGKIPDEVFTKEFKLPESDGTGSARDLARRALALLKEASWEIKDGKMTELKTGKKLAFEMLLNDASFERVVLPYKQNLERIGIDMNVRTVDTAQFKRREDEFDYDMMVEGFGQSLSPGNEQRDFWGSKAADTPGSRNTLGIRNEAIDSLIDTLIAAPDRESLINVTRALDRVLLWSHFVVPNWHSNTAYVAYWNRFARPAKAAKYAPVAFDTWWIDEARTRRCSGGEEVGSASAQACHLSGARHPWPFRRIRSFASARVAITQTSHAPTSRRLMLVVPTLIGIMVINFFIIQAPRRPASRCWPRSRHGGGRNRALRAARAAADVSKSAADTSGGGATGARGCPRS
jgi:microcin C transport system substrate-binding protein